MYTIGIVFVLVVVQTRGQISLEYKPMRPFYHPRPSGSYIKPIIPPGTPWPARGPSYDTTIVNRIKETTTMGSTSGFLWPSPSEEMGNTEYQTNPDLVDKTKEPMGEAPPSINIEYKPNRPPFHPSPGNTIGQIIPSGKPWPARPEDQQNFSPDLENRVKETTTSKVTTTSQTSISLEYKPNRPFHHPKPATGLNQIIPPGKPWPSSQEGYENFTQTQNRPSLENRVQVTSTTVGIQEETPISLEYKPTRPPFHPNPGNNIGQIVPPGEPWPSSDQGYQNFSQTTNLDFENRIKETTTNRATTSNSLPQQSSISLEYKPNRPFHHPKPATGLSQIIPPGKPWPSSSEDYQNSSQVTNSTNFENRIKETTTNKITTQETISLEYKPIRPFHHPKPATGLNQIIPPGKPWPSSEEGYQNSSQVTNSTNFENRIKETTTNKVATQDTISLEYKPNRPFHHPKPATGPSQIIPPGNPWPNSPEGYQNSSQMTNSTNFENRIKETTTNKVATQDTISLEYKPNRPFHHPKPATGPSQIIPPGQPWPSSPEGYENSTQTQNRPIVENRVQITRTTIGIQEDTPISLEYKPTRPPFHPNPGNNIGQIIPPGEPWPSSAEGYQNFSQTTNLNFENRIKETTTNRVTTSNSPQEQTPISLEYKPNRPFYHPNPSSGPSQIIPPGKPWPSSPEGYQINQTRNASLENRIQVTTPTGIQEETPISLEYKPSRPPFHPNPGNNIGQIVPPGEPWPSSPEGNQNFSTNVNRFNKPNLESNKSSSEDFGQEATKPDQTITTSSINIEYPSVNSQDSQNVSQTDFLLKLVFGLKEENGKATKPTDSDKEKIEKEQKLSSEKSSSKETNSEKTSIPVTMTSELESTSEGRLYTSAL